MKKRQFFTQFSKYAGVMLVLGAFCMPLVSQAQTRTRATKPAIGAKPRVALVLSSGSARGFAHIGIIKAFDEAGIHPDLIVGSSAGSVVGVFYAAGYTGKQMEEIAMKVRDADVIDVSVNSKRGLVAGESLQRLVNTMVKEKTIENLPTRFVAVATNLKTGEPVLLRSGDAGQAVRASSSMPGVFLPTVINGQELVDGAVTSPLPVSIARQLGAQTVIAVDVGSPSSNVTSSGIYEIVMQSFDIMGLAISKLEAKGADYLIKPDVARFASSDFSSRSQLIAAGYAAGKAAIAKMRKIPANAPAAQDLLSGGPSAGNASSSPNKSTQPML